ncbi:hypothetical protein [Bradyrhizobium pachyrhizi]|uniref:hypothetical protein n=1 Tax=Bradyrhizobium pachyrhizi TaxID=280333 RepID=UPI000A93E4E5|nr:hypothetical protein [Bradyrhizobium pachyrhizi]
MDIRAYAILAFSILFLSGCAVDNFDVPRDESNAPSLKSIVQEVTCELAVIADPNYQYSADMTAGDYVIAVELDLTVNDDGSLAPSFTYTNGPFSFGAGAKLDVQREHFISVPLTYSIADLRAQMEADKRASVKFGRKVDSLACPTVADTPLATNLGIESTVHMAMNTAHIASQTKLTGAKAGELAGYTKFVVVKNLNSVGPTWTLTSFKGPGPLAGLSETNTDQVYYAFAERAANGLIPGPTLAQNAKRIAQNRIADAKATQANTTLSLIQANTNH